MNNFRVGDRVLYAGKDYGTVKATSNGEDTTTIALEMDNPKSHHDCNGLCKMKRGWWASVSLCELIKPAHPTIIIHTDGITTTTLMKQGKKVVKQAHAVCSPSDTYDHEFGVRLALDRLFGHDVKAAPPAQKKPRIVKQERYSVGDKVRVVDVWTCKDDVVSDMDKWRGKTLTIDSVHDGGEKYRVKETGWWWYSHCFKGKVVE